MPRTGRIDRRKFMALVPVACLVLDRAGAAQAEASVLQESDTEAVSFQYRADARKVDKARNPSYKPGQTCANCSQFYPHEGSPHGGCQLFLTKEVAAIGWCNAWEARPQ